MKISELLKQHGLRSTDIRRRVLQIFLESSFALSHADLEDQLPRDTDRVTLYRTLRSFEETGVIHRVVNDLDQLQFALCRDDCQHSEAHHEHREEHVHFQCNQCQKTFCLPIPLPKLPMPSDYQMEDCQVLVRGRCKDCK